MVDINLWRARIGHFHLLRISAAMGRRETQAFDSCDIITSADMLVCLIVLSTLVRLTFCLFSTYKSMNNIPFQLVFEGKEIRGITSTWERSGDETDFVACDLKVTIQVPVLMSLCAANMAWSLRKILLSNDVEVNPGPQHGRNEGHAVTKEPGQGNGKEEAATETRPESLTDILTAIQKQGQLFQTQIETQTQKLQEQLEKHGQEQAKQNNIIRSELSEMKNDLRKVSEKCEEINERCNKLEGENTKLTDSVSEIARDVKELHLESNERKEENERVSEMLESLQGEVNRMNSEIDRLEEFSRRDNLRMFGIESVSVGEREDNDDCCAAVCGVLNRVDVNREWTERDIVRAHRVGQARSGQPRPMIVKFSQWRDKMKLITDKAFRGQLEREGTRVANDLTHRQMAIVAEAKKEGKSAYFVKGKMTIGPKRPDPRNFAQVVAGVELSDSNSPVVPHPSDSDLVPSASPFLPQDSPSLIRSDVIEPRPRDSFLLKEGMANRQRASSTGDSQSRAGKESVSRSRAITPSVGGKRQQLGISSYLRGQHSQEVRSQSTSNLEGGRTLRSCTNAAK